MVKHTVDYLVDLALQDAQHTADLRHRYSHALCAADLAMIIEDHHHPTHRQGFVLHDTEPRPLLTARTRYKGEDELINERIPVIVNAMVAAAYLGDVALIRHLIDQGADVNAESKYYEPPLQQAAMMGHYDAVLLLLESGANVQHIVPAAGGAQGDSNRALGKACSGGHQRVVFLLLEEKYGLERRKGTMRHAIVDAARGGHTKLVEALLESWEFRKAGKAKSKCFTIAVQNGHEPLARQLLTHGVSLDNVKKDPNKTILEMAACTGKVSIVRLLLENGVKREDGALALAAKNGYVDVANLLLNYPGSINKVDMLDGKEPFCVQKSSCLPRLSPLMAAIENGEFSMVRVLLELGATVNISMPEYDPLIAAVRVRECGIAELLIQAGASPDGLDWRGPASRPRHGPPMEEAMSQNGTMPGDISRLLDRYGAVPFDSRNSRNHEYHKQMVHGAGCADCRMVQRLPVKLFCTNI